jgi:hypothetical protein
LGISEESAKFGVFILETTAMVAVAFTPAGGEMGAVVGRAYAKVPPGPQPTYGTAVHAALASEIRALGRSDISPEVSYLNGQIVPYGTEGSIRPDVVLGDPLSPNAVLDLKTGVKGLSEARVSTMQAHLPRSPSGEPPPVCELRK